MVLANIIIHELFTISVLYDKYLKLYEAIKENM